jgi:hypothetical protein
MVPNLETRLREGGDVIGIADLVRHDLLTTVHHLMLSKIQKGVSSARSDDTKGLKGPILDWIVPTGQTLNPPLARNVKVDRGFHHERTGALLCPAGMDWSDPEYDFDIMSGISYTCLPC